MSLEGFVTLTTTSSPPQSFILHLLSNPKSNDVFSTKDFICDSSKSLAQKLKSEQKIFLEQKGYKIHAFKMKAPPLVFLVYTSGLYTKQIAENALDEYQQLFFSNINIDDLRGANKDLFLSLPNDEKLFEKYKLSA